MNFVIILIAIVYCKIFKYVTGERSVKVATEVEVGIFNHKMMSKDLFQ